MRRPLLVALLLGLLLPLTACGGLSFGGGGNGYNDSGTGAVAQIAIDDRDDSVDLRGTDLEGKPVDVADYRGKPVVVVVWGAWCVECNQDAADVVSVADSLGSSAHFLGIDIRDSGTDYPLAYERSYDVPYPSIYDPSSSLLLDFPAGISPRTVPAFAVLDDQGRVAATITGKLPSKLTLEQVVQQVAAEGSTDG